jgi:hypothetical protein
MAEIVRKGTKHHCLAELNEFGYSTPFGTVVKCSCGRHWRLRKKCPIPWVLAEILLPGSWLECSRGLDWWYRTWRR